MCISIGTVGMCIRMAILYMYMGMGTTTFCRLISVRLTKKWNRAKGIRP